MFRNHKIIYENGKEVLLVFMDLDTEFSTEFFVYKEQKQDTNLEDDVNSYVKSRKVNFNGNDVKVISNGVVVSSFHY